jgi:hypothetical protein
MTDRIRGAKWFGATAMAFTAGVLFAVGPSASANQPVTGADFTTVNEGVDGTGHCQNGNPNVNCNVYDGKQYVWLSSGPGTSASSSACRLAS